MKSKSKWATGILALTLAAPIFAQSRADYRDAQRDDRSYAFRSYENRDAFLRGRVERVDYRTGTIWLRDFQRGETVRATASRHELRGVRRGDRVQLVGRWDRGSFEVRDIR
jgi:hypothetical protein